MKFKRSAILNEEFRYPRLIKVLTGRLLGEETTKRRGPLCFCKHYFRIQAKPLGIVDDRCAIAARELVYCLFISNALLECSKIIPRYNGYPSIKIYRWPRRWPS